MLNPLTTAGGCKALLFVFEPFEHMVQSGQIHHSRQWPLGVPPSNFQRGGGREVGGQNQERRPSSKDIVELNLSPGANTIDWDLLPCAT